MLKLLALSIKRLIRPFVCQFSYPPASLADFQLNQKPLLKPKSFARHSTSMKTVGKVTYTESIWASACTWFRVAFRAARD